MNIRSSANKNSKYMKMYRLDKKRFKLFLRKFKLMVETDDCDTKND